MQAHHKAQQTQSDHKEMQNGYEGPKNYYKATETQQCVPEFQSGCLAAV